MAVDLICKEFAHRTPENTVADPLESADYLWAKN